ncbi:hypothetical protein MTO96_005749 [Rhipicephalus appendiculatus]
MSFRIIEQTGLPRVTYDAEDYFLLPPGVSVQEFCSERMDTVSRTLPLTYPPTPLFVENTPAIQYRQVFCVFDVRHWRSEEPYTPYLLPFSYCEAIILTGYGVNGATGSLLEKDNSLTTFARTLQNIQPLHGSHKTFVYVTLGGDRVDSANLSQVASDRRARGVLVGELSRNLPQLWQGVHLDWNYPGDKCSKDASAGARYFSELLNDLLNARMSVIVSVPPLEDRMRWYDLNKHMRGIRYVIIKTHTLRYPDLVSCSGERTYAAQAYNEIRKTFDPVFWWKLAYSVSVAPETFTAQTAALGAYSSGPSAWDTYTQQPGKAHFATVCKLDKIRTPDHPECLMASRPADNENLYVATFSDEAALMQRMSQSYDDGMGVAPVVVYDVDMDDYLGNCSGAATMSPLVRALASGVSESVTNIFN